MYVVLPSRTLLIHFLISEAYYLHLTDASLQTQLSQIDALCDNVRTVYAALFKSIVLMVQLVIQVAKLDQLVDKLDEYSKKLGTHVRAVYCYSSDSSYSYLNLLFGPIVESQFQRHYASA